MAPSRRHEHDVAGSLLTAQSFANAPYTAAAAIGAVRFRATMTAAATAATFVLVRLQKRVVTRVRPRIVDIAESSSCWRPQRPGLEYNEGGQHPEEEEEEEAMKSR